MTRYGSECESFCFCFFNPTNASGVQPDLGSSSPEGLQGYCVSIMDVSRKDSGRFCCERRMVKVKVKAECTARVIYVNV